MSSKKTLSGGWKNLLLFLSLGFLIIWIMEFRRTSLADSYWLLLLLLVCLLWYQLLNLKGRTAGESRQQESREESGVKTGKPSSKKGK